LCRNLSTPQLISLGSINLDLQMRADRAPAFGYLSIGRDFVALGGGKAANVSYVAHGLGADVRLIGHVGADLLADDALRGLRDVGVDLSSVRALPSSPTGVAWIMVGPKGDKSITVAGNANDRWTDEEIDEVAAIVASAPKGSVLLADLEVPESVVRRAAEAAKASGCTFILDPSPPDRVSPELYALTDIITPDRGEAESLTRRRIRSVADGRRAGEQLLERGVLGAVVKIGASGCVVVTRERADHVPAAKVDAVDTTGAGDAFAAALAVALLGGRNLIQAARYGAAAASLVVTCYGARPPYPIKAEIDRLFEASSSPRHLH
jgi:ribokinase